MEITRIRRLIHRIKPDVADLDDTERARIDDAVAVVRRHRAAHTVPLGMTMLTTPSALRFPRKVDRGYAAWPAVVSDCSYATGLNTGKICQTLALQGKSLQAGQY